MKDKFPTLSPAEYTRRIRIAQSLMRQEKIDLIITFSTFSEPRYSRYFADFCPCFETAGVLIPAEGEGSLLVGPESGERAALVGTLRVVRRLLAFREPNAPKYEDPSFDSFAQIFSSLDSLSPIATVGIGGWEIIPMEILNEIRSQLDHLHPGIRLVSADNLLCQISRIKSDEEVACLRKGAWITRQAMDVALAAIRPGMTCAQLKGIALAKLYELGAEDEAFCGWVTCAEETAFAISGCSKRPIRQGDLVQIQIGARYCGYASVIGRPAVLGRATPAQRELLSSCLEAKQAVEEALKGGAESESVANAHRAVLQQRGHESWMVYGPCHSIGMMECEGPWIESGVSYRLEKNMVFCADLFLQDPVSCLGARYEDMLLVTEDGMERLTGYPDRLFEI